MREGDAPIVEELQAKSKVALTDISEEVKTVEHRRDRHDIIAEILKTAKSGQKKTYIMYKARLSHAQLKLYLELLNRNGMIINDEGVYKTTPKGLTFVREFEAINFLVRQ